MSFANHPTYTTLCIINELASKVSEKFNNLINWLKEIRLKGQAGKKGTNFKFKEGQRET